jgi:hypothetical protein
MTLLAHMLSVGYGCGEPRADEAAHWFDEAAKRLGYHPLEVSGPLLGGPGPAAAGDQAPLADQGRARRRSTAHGDGPHADPQQQQQQQAAAVAATSYHQQQQQHLQQHHPQPHQQQQQFYFQPQPHHHHQQRQDDRRRPDQSAGQ